MWGKGIRHYNYFNKWNKRVKAHYGGVALGKKMYFFGGIFWYILGTLFL
jgi:hypothetical protein